MKGAKPTRADYLDKLERLKELKDEESKIRAELGSKSTKDSQLDKITELLQQDDEPKLISSNVIKAPTENKPQLFAPRMAKII